MRITETQFGICTAGHFMAEHEGADSRHITLKGQYLQVDHQFGVVGKCIGYADRLLDFR